MKQTLLFLIFLLASCSTSRYQLPEDKSKIDFKLPYSIQDIIIVDLRDSFPPFDWSQGMDKAQRQNIHGKPKLTDQNKSEIESIINSAQVKEGGIPSKFEFTLLEGSCSLKKHRQSIREFIGIRAELRVTTEKYAEKKHVIAAAKYEHPVFDHSAAHAEAVYNLVLKNVTAELLREIRDLSP